VIWSNEYIPALWPLEKVPLNVVPLEVVGVSVLLTAQPFSARSASLDTTGP